MHGIYFLEKFIQISILKDIS